MNQQIELIEGTNRDHSLSQFFTPPKLAAKLVEWAIAGRPRGYDHARPMRVLEPSAGNGAIVRELVKAGAAVVAVEVDARYALELAKLKTNCVWHDDFLKLKPVSCAQYDLCVGNFPFHLDETGEFTLHALEFCPRVCAIYPSNFFYSEQRIEFWKQVRPTRIAHIAKRPWPGATDYVALELSRWDRLDEYERGTPCTVEFWTEAWR